MNCLAWPCPNARVDGGRGYCAEHRPKRARVGVKADPRYQRKRWRNTRRLVMANAGGMCEDCAHAEAEQVHHVTPTTLETPDVEFYCWWPHDDGTPRMLALCARCHGRQVVRVPNVKN